MAAPKVQLNFFFVLWEGEFFLDGIFIVSNILVSMEFYGIFHEMIDELLWMLVHGKKVPNATLPGPKGWENLP